jgi:YVTN family beta-propeller protein
VTGTVTRIDERSGTVLGPIHAGSGADAVAVGTGGIWVANTLDGTVTRIDPETNAVASTIPVGDGPSGIAVAPGSVWVSNAFAGTLTRIDPARNGPFQTVTTGNRPQGVVVEPDGLFVAVRASGTGHRGGTLRVLGASGYLSNGIDPSTAYLGDEVGIARLTNDGLVGYLKTGGAAGLVPVPDLAVSLPSPTDGGPTYSFRLRPGIRYSAGGVVRPADVRWSLERSLEAGGYYSPYFARIVGAGRCLAAPKKPCDLSRGIVTDAPAGQSVTVWGQRFFHIPTEARRYIVSVLDSLGLKARFRDYPGNENAGGQVVHNGWYADYAAPAGFLPAVLTCGAYKTNPVTNLNASGFCDPAIDREIARADALQTTNPEAASLLWAKVDRDLTDRAPWAAFANNSVVEVKSPRVGNYQVNPQLGTLIDQLWVR